MGWLKWRLAATKDTPTLLDLGKESKCTTEHVEHISLSLPDTHTSSHIYPFVPISVPDAELPYIPAEEVRKRKVAADGSLLIVVDNVVYNCAQFVFDHPGGNQIIEAFAGAECSWQFWRFHGKREMEEFGKALRVGRTEGLKNKFKEPVKYVGLRPLGDAWD